VAIGQYFEGHAKAAFALMGSDGKLQTAKKVWGVVTRYGFREFKASDLWKRHLRRSFSKTADLETALNTLEELGYVRQVATPKRDGPGKPPSPTFEVNPLACSLNSLNSGESWEEEV
jgi:replicative DNA helicase